MLNNSIEGVLDLDFTYEFSSLGRTYTFRLSEPGEKLGAVDDSNKKEYEKRLTYWKLHGEIEHQVKAFKEGFHQFVREKHLELIMPSELSRMITGESEISVEELRKNAKYGGYEQNSEQVIWFWEIISMFDQDTLSSLLFFISGIFV